jgi:hypothetical protein
MTGRTKGGAQRARTLKAYVRWGGSPVTATPLYHLPPEDGRLTPETCRGFKTQ